MKPLFRIAVVISFIVILVAVISYSRGYRFDFKKKSMTSTGILSFSSYPNAAKVYINNELRGVTNLNQPLIPGRYHVEVKKDGYTSWNKDIILKGELVMTIDALLFPLNPSLSPQTNLGIVKAVPIDQTGKVILFSQTENPEKDGLYLFDSSFKPLSIFPPLKLILLKKNLDTYGSFDFKNTRVFFSPDYKEAIFEFEETTSKSELNTSNNINNTTQSFLLALDEENKSLFDVTSSKETLLEAWQKETDNNNQKILEAFPKTISKIASESFKIVSLSPDETKIFYQAANNESLPLVVDPPLIASNQTPEDRNLKKNSYYIYDKKEDKNYFIKLSSEDIVNWYPDSEHLLFVDKKKIVASDYDGLNEQAIYSGPFENSFFTTTNDGKIIILTNLNPEVNKYGDLYLVGIK